MKCSMWKPFRTKKKKKRQGNKEMKKSKREVRWIKKMSRVGAVSYEKLLESKGVRGMWN